MTKKLYLNVFAVVVLAFTLISSADACVSYNYGQGYGPTHGWNGQPIRLDYSMGGPNILINETTGLTVSEISSRSYNAFGYFTYNPANGAILEEHGVTFDNEGKAYIGEFETGERVGTWLSTDNGKFYSVPKLNESNQHRATYLGDTPEGNLKIGLEGGPKWSGTDYREMVVAFEPTEHAPAGQPLPGVFISALIGLGLTGLAGIKKHKKSLTGFYCPFLSLVCLKKIAIL